MTLPAAHQFDHFHIVKMHRIRHGGKLDDNSFYERPNFLFVFASSRYIAQQHPLLLRLRFLVQRFGCGQFPIIVQARQQQTPTDAEIEHR